MFFTEQLEGLLLERHVLHAIDGWIYDTVKEHGVDSERIDGSCHLDVGSSCVAHDVHKITDPAQYEAQGDCQHRLDHVLLGLYHLCCLDVGCLYII